MTECNQEGFDRSHKIIVKWIISIAVIGGGAYFLPISLLQNELITNLSNLIIGVNRWANGSYYPDQMKLIWVYIYITFPFITVASFLTLDFSLAFNKTMPIFKKDIVSILFIFISLSTLSYFTLKMFFLNEFLFGEHLYKDGPIQGTASANFASGTYLGNLFLMIIMSYSSSMIPITNIFLIPHFFLRLIKRREL